MNYLDRELHIRSCISNPSEWSFLSLWKAIPEYFCVWLNVFLGIFQNLFHLDKDWSKIWMFKLEYVHKLLRRNIFSEMSLGYVWYIWLRNIFSNIFDWCHRYTLSKCWKSNISKGKQYGGYSSEVTHKKVCTLAAYL